MIYLSSPIPFISPDLPFPATFQNQIRYNPQIQMYLACLLLSIPLLGIRRVHNLVFDAAQADCRILLRSELGHARLGIPAMATAVKSLPQPVELGGEKFALFRERLIYWHVSAEAAQQHTAGLRVGGGLDSLDVLHWPDDRHRLGVVDRDRARRARLALALLPRLGRLAWASAVLRDGLGDLADEALGPLVRMIAVDATQVRLIVKE